MPNGRGYYKKYLEGYREAEGTLGEIGETITNAASSAVNIIEKTLTAPVDEASERIDDLSDRLDNIVDTITGLPSKIMSGIQERFNRIKLFFESFVESIETAFSDIADALTKPIINALDSIGSTFKVAFNTVANAFNSIANSIQSSFNAIRDAITKAVDDAWRSLTNWIELLRSSITETLTAIASTVEMTLEDVWNAIMSIGDTIQDLNAEFQKTLDDLYSNMPYYIGKGTGIMVEKMLEVVLPRMIEIMSEVVKGFSKGFGEVEIDLEKVKQEARDMILAMQDVQRELTQAFKPS